MIAARLRITLFLALWWMLLPAANQAAALASGSAAVPLTIEDDLDLHGLDEALSRSLAFLRTASPAGGGYQFGGRTVPVQRFIDTHHHLRQVLQSRPSPAAFQREIQSRFDLVAMDTCGDTVRQRMLITGYYQPVFAGSLDRRPPYVHPLFRVPDDLVIHKKNGRKQVQGRQEGGKIVPYWTRREIEQGNLLAGQELVWLKDRFDAFVLHVQGSGIIHLADGSRRGVRYAVNNGHAYASIGKYLVDTGRMQLADVTMDSIRRYLELHPEEYDQILHHNDSFIFFHWGEPGPAIGSLGQPLTPGRSVAADHRCYPPGSLVFLDSRRPIVAGNDQVATWQPMRRLVTVQDRGSAIIGPGRLDVFWGTGDQAGREAGQMKEDGAAYLVLLKTSAPH